MILRKYFFLFFVFLSYLPILAQVDSAWVRRYNGPGDNSDVATAITVDKSNNVYVTGGSYGSGTNIDYATIKYAPDGTSLWVSRWNGTGNYYDKPHALAVDKSGNVYVTGYSWSGISLDFVTIKYAPNGDTLWVRPFNSPGNGNDASFALAVDEGGNVYVTGRSGSVGNFNYATVKYTPQGDTVWVRFYDGVVNKDDEPIALAVDESGNVYVTGYSDNYYGGTGYDYATIKYAPNGDTVWVRLYNGPANSTDIAQALALDNSGNVYVTGYSIGSGTSFDYATVKYAPNGDLVWERRYNSSLYDQDWATALAVDDSGNVYVTGTSWGGQTYYDYATFKYVPNGDSLWMRRYNGQGIGFSDFATDLAVDKHGNLYVSGYSSRGFAPNHSYDYGIIKYAPNGDTSWVLHYNGPGNSRDEPLALTVDESGNVYVTGGSVGSETFEDYATLKLIQGCIARAGDVTGDGNVSLPDIISLVNHIFKGGPKPQPACRGDANVDGKITLPDIIYAVNYVFKGGPAPVKSGVCCL